MVQAMLISKGRNGTAEVVTYLGEGAERRSITVHLRVGRDGRWTSRNPDKAALARLNAAEKVENSAAAVVAFFVMKVAIVEGTISLLQDARKDGDIDRQEYKNARQQAGRLHKLASAKLADAKGISEAAKKAADEVRAEVPRYSEFVF